jgi:hypothetical protein
MNRATAESAADAAEEEGLHPLMAWVKEELLDPVIQRDDLGFGYDDIEFVWLPEPEVDEQKQMITITGYVKVGLMTMDEGREQINLPPYPNGAGAEPLVLTGQGPVPLAETVEANKQKALAVPDQLGNQQEAHNQRMSNFSAPGGGGSGGPPDTAVQPPQKDGEVGKISRTPFRRDLSGSPVRRRGQSYGADALAQDRTRQHGARCGGEVN